MCYLVWCSSFSLGGYASDFFFESGNIQLGLGTLWFLYVFYIFSDPKLFLFKKPQHQKPLCVQTTRPDINPQTAARLHLSECTRKTLNVRRETLRAPTYRCCERGLPASHSSGYRTAPTRFPGGRRGWLEAAGRHTGTNITSLAARCQKWDTISFLCTPESRRKWHFRLN